MASSYAQLWDCMRGMESSMRTASELYGHLLRHLPKSGRESYPTPGTDGGYVERVVEGVARIVPGPIGPIGCPTPPNCIPPPWGAYSEWMGMMANTMTALAGALQRMSADPALAEAIRAFERTPAYRSANAGGGGDGGLGA